MQGCGSMEKKLFTLFKVEAEWSCSLHESFTSSWFHCSLGHHLHQHTNSHSGAPASYTHHVCAGDEDFTSSVPVLVIFKSPANVVGVSLQTLLPDQRKLWV